MATTTATESFQPRAPFPEDVPTAPLLRLSLHKLLQREPSELERFNRACEDVGFFYLDLKGHGDSLLRDANALFSVGEALFDLPLPEKQKYDFSEKKTYFGYKAQGAAVVDRQGNLDRNEFYNVSKDDILGMSDPWPAPSVLNEQRPLLKSFIVSAHSVVTLVHELLNEHLGLPAETLPSLHRIDGRSGDQVRFVKAPPQPPNDRKTALGEHTDFGSVTVLFNRLGGLQILPPGKNAQWCYVKPLPGHAIINLGDAMVKFTNGLLRSNIHRVVSPPGAQADHTRYSLVYFNRPEDDVMLKRLEGSNVIPPLAEGEQEEEINSKDWIIRRALAKRTTNGDSAYDWDKHRGTEAKSQRAYL